MRTRRSPKTLGIRLAYSEGIQAQRYDVGQQFKAHTDYFEPGTPEYAKFGGNRGNRTWTFMVYLNEGMGGGGTKFFAIDHTFVPKKGQAVIWNNLNPDGTPNAATLHSGEPVTSGHKIIITKWFRELGSGPDVLRRRSEVSERFDALAGRERAEHGAALEIEARDRAFAVIADEHGLAIGANAKPISAVPADFTTFWGACRFAASRMLIWPVGSAVSTRRPSGLKKHLCRARDRGPSRESSRSPRLWRWR